MCVCVCHVCSDTMELDLRLLNFQIDCILSFGLCLHYKSVPFPSLTQSNIWHLGWSGAQWDGGGGGGGSQILILILDRGVLQRVTKSLKGARGPAQKHRNWGLGNWREGLWNG